jgi:diguanylate cyclase (GGDEF)-like protein
MLEQTRSVCWHNAKMLTFDRLLTDFILMVVGYVMVLLYQADGWLLLPAMALLGLVFKVLKGAQLEKAAQTDTKTGLLNAGHWHRCLREELARAHFFKHSLALILVDLDGLRTINNTYGHLAGDVVIAGIAQLLQRHVRGYDIVGRFGGEEFAVVLPEAEREQARAVAEQLRQAVAAASFPHPSLAITLRATASFGVATFPAQGVTIDQLIHQADVALYQAKANGKNCVVSAEELPDATQLSVPSNLSPYQAAFATSAQHSQ